MDSNEHGIMEQNEEHHETNISIYYTHETELYAESYDAMNKSMSCKNLGLGEIGGGEKVNPVVERIWIGAGARRAARRSSGRSRPEERRGTPGSAGMAAEGGGEDGAGACRRAGAGGRGRCGGAGSPETMTPARAREAGAAGGRKEAGRGRSRLGPRGAVAGFPGRGGAAYGAPRVAL